MAEATDFTGDSSTRAANSSADSSNTIMVPTSLEDLAEEEDVFLPYGGEDRTTFRTRECPVNDSQTLQTRRETTALTLESQMENEFLHLTIRKQVSYR